jgi:hypothetical protein
VRFFEVLLHRESLTHFALSSAIFYRSGAMLESCEGLEGWIEVYGLDVEDGIVLDGLEDGFHMNRLQLYLLYP